MIGFHIKKYSDFQYLLPLNLFLKENGFETYFFADDNFSFVKTYKLSEIDTFKLTHFFSIDCFFETKYDFVKRKFKHIIIQNYHDIFSSLNKKINNSFYKNCDFLWIENNKFKKELKKKNIKNNIICEITPNYWRYFKLQKSKISEKYVQYAIDKQKVAICYMPRAKSLDFDNLKNETETSLSFVNHAINFGRFLEENGFAIIYKQKPQFRYEIGSDNNLIVSDTLFPNESMDLGYMSSFGFGYMTCAQMHHHNFNIKYINFLDNRYPNFSKDLIKIYYTKNLIEQRNIMDDFETNLKFIKQKEFIEKTNLDDAITNSKEKILKILK